MAILVLCLHHGFLCTVVAFQQLRLIVFARGKNEESEGCGSGCVVFAGWILPAARAAIFRSNRSRDGQVWGRNRGRQRVS